MLFQKHSIEWWAVKALAVAVILGVVGYAIYYALFLLQMLTFMRH